MKAFFSKLVGNKISPIGRRESVQRIGDYTVVRKIGSGGTSDVYLGLHVDTMATAAIKQLGLKCSTLSHKEMFVTESLLCGVLDHPNIINVYSANLDEPGGAYLVMEYVEGNSLDRHENPDTLLPIDKVVDIMRQSAEALDYLAAEGVIHRDIKPGNLILRKDGRVKIADFGCAIVSGRSSASLRVAGSLPFMAPEQIAGKAIDYRADMYSLGAVFYRLLTGCNPIAAEDGELPPSYARKILTTNYVPVTQYRQDVPAGIIRVIDRVLQKKPEERYESWGMFKQALYRSSMEKRTEDEELAAHWKSFEIFQQEQIIPSDYNLSFGF